MRASVTDDSPSGTPPSPGRSLVPVTAATPGSAAPSRSRPSAAFLAQLIAIAQGAPQTRARRRAGAGTTTAVYEAESGRPRTGPHKLTRLA